VDQPRDPPVRRRLTSTAVVVSTFLVVLVLLVPWTLTQPVLMMKVRWRGSREGRRAQLAAVRGNARLILLALGWGVLLGLQACWGWRGATALGLSAIVVTFGASRCWRLRDRRYALLVAPGAV
jgi:hypothetical protein